MSFVALSQNTKNECEEMKTKPQTIRSLFTSDHDWQSDMNFDVHLCLDLWWYFAQILHIWSLFHHFYSVYYAWCCCCCCCWWRWWYAALHKQIHKIDSCNFCEFMRTKTKFSQYFAILGSVVIIFDAQIPLDSTVFS